MKDKTQEMKYDLKPDEKAFIYQQISEFEAFFMPDSNVGVKVDRVEDDSGQKEYHVTLKLTGGGTFVESVGRGDNFFEATRSAKEDLLAHLHSIQEAVSREAEHEDPTGQVSIPVKYLH